MIIDGKAIAEGVYVELERELTSFSRPLRLGIVLGMGDAATESFVRIKTRAAERLGVELVREELPAGAASAEALKAVERLAQKTNGVIVQLPLPPSVDAEAVLRAIPKDKDIDAVNPDIVDGERIVVAPVAAAVGEVLHMAHIDPRGKEAVVVGKGRLVGTPVAHYLLAREACVTTLEAGDSLLPLKTADIVVLGAGSPGLVKPEHLKKGVALIDAGTSEASGKIAGDADPTCADIAAVFTPVPGGVGPVAVAMIFRNLFELAQRKATI